jgi:hypothetical protein
MRSWRALDLDLDDEFGEGGRDVGVRVRVLPPWSHHDVRDEHAQARGNGDGQCLEDPPVIGDHGVQATLDAFRDQVVAVRGSR